MIRLGTCVWLLFLVLHARVISGSTLLRTAVIAREEGTSSAELAWLSDSGRRRQLLGLNEGRDGRWGPLLGRAQLLLQLAEGYTSQDADRLVAQLTAYGALISSSLPDHTWLVLASPEALQLAAYKPHDLVPYLPEYKLAPEWHPVLELVQQQAQPKADAGISHHLQVHKRILAHESLEHVRVAEAAQHLRHAAAASTADVALSQELRQQAPGKVLIGVHFAEVQHADLLRLKVKADSFHPAAAAATEWNAALRAVVMAAKRSPEHQQLCKPELVANSPWELDVAVCPQDLSEVLHWLSNQAVVHWLAPRPRIYYQNAAAARIIQSSTMKTALDYSTPEAAAFWNAGLDGRGQIVGIGDSGIDMNSCFFSDPAVPFVPPSGGKEWANPQHRKVVYYWGMADETFRDLVGHGTHTAGSIAGYNPAAPDSKATGAAKGARLAFVDLSRTAGGDVNAPQDLERNYFPKMFERGACIFSDSWGSTSPVYDFQASKLDSWLYNNQDCVSHFAAGNYGENDNLDSTITSPATAKNTITVGATKSAVANYVSQTIAPVFMMSVEIKRPNIPLQYVGVRLVRAEFGGDGSNLSNKGFRMVRSVPDTACSPLEGAAGGGYSNTVLLVRRGSCYFSKKLEMGAAAGAAAVVVINDQPGGYFKMDAQVASAVSAATGEAVSLFSVTKRIGEQLWSFFDTAEQVAATIERYAQGWPAYEDIASFSSFGPTKDGRIKPDIVGPGELVSATSGDLDPATESAETCNIGRKAGTSMATPMVAGHTAIVRQYFMEGFYPSGAPGNTPFLPSGPLMKAVMLGGACDMQGNTEQYLPLEDSPSMRQGFGRFCLCNALKLTGNCTTNVQLVDRVPITSQDSHKYCLRTTGGDLRVTLSWYDYPALVSAEKTLVNDLDLTVVSGGMGGQAFFGNMNLQKDSVNTVERVWLRNVPPGGLEITVSSGQLSPNTRSQNYSLVVQGAFVDTLNSMYNPDPTAARTLGGCSAEVMATPPLPQVQAAAAVVVEKGPAAAVAASPAIATAAVAAVSTANATATVAQPQPATPPAVTDPAAAATAAAAAPTVPPTVPPLAPVPDAAAAQPVAGPLPQVQTTTTDQVSLVSALYGTMMSAQGRRLTSWMHASNMSAVTKVPLMVCRWINATAKRAAAAADTGAGTVRRLQAQQAAVQPDGRSALLLLPLQHLVLAAVVVAVCAVLLGIGVRRYQVYRSVSLTSAVHKDVSLNKAMGRTPTGHGALLEALLLDPSLIPQLSPKKRANLGLAASSPFECNTASRSSGGSSGSGASPTHSGTESPVSPAPYEPLRVRLARHNAAGSSAPSPYRPCSVPPSSILPSHSAPLPAMRSAPVSPVGTPGGSFSRGMNHPTLSTAAAAAPGSELRVVVSDRPISRLSEGGPPLPGPPFSPECCEGSPRLQRSFTSGSAPTVCEVFGLSGKVHSSPEALPDMEVQHQQQLLHSKGMQDQQQHAIVQLDFPAAAAAAAGQASGDAGHQRDQQH